MSTAIEELVSLCRNGDEDAWKQLVEEYRDLVYGICRGKSASAHDAEDLMQDAFLKYGPILPATIPRAARSERGSPPSRATLDSTPIGATGKIARPSPSMKRRTSQASSSSGTLSIRAPRRTISPPRVKPLKSF
jgi:Sigma-70 region 2